MPKVLTSEARCSFVNVFQPGRNDKYSVALLFPDPATLSGSALKDYERCMTELKAAAKEAAEDKWGAKAPKGLKSPFLDAGDMEYDGYEEGMICIRTTSKQRPGVVDENVQPIIDESEFYSGCYGRATINAFAYDTDGNRGVSFGLQNVQKLRDGDPMGGRSKPEDDFAPVTDNDASSADMSSFME